MSLKLSVTHDHPSLFTLTVQRSNVTLVAGMAVAEVIRWFKRSKQPWWDGRLSGKFVVGTADPSYLGGRSAVREVFLWFRRPKQPWWNGLLSGNLSIVQTTQATLVGRSAVREVWQPMTLTAGRCCGSDVGPGQSGSYRTSMLSTRTVAERLSTAISRSTAAITCRASRV